MYNLKTSNDWSQKLSLFGLLFALLLTLGTALPVAAQEDLTALCPADSSSCETETRPCDANVKINEINPKSPNVVVPYTWDTTGTAVAHTTIEILSHPDFEVIWSSGEFSNLPDGNDAFHVPSTAFDGPGIYWVRVTISTGCGSSSMFMRPFYYPFK